MKEVAIKSFSAGHPSQYLNFTMWPSSGDCFVNRCFDFSEQADPTGFEAFATDLLNSGHAFLGLKRFHVR
jgi:hypothetical protein